MSLRNKVVPFSSGEKFGRLTILRCLGRVTRAGPKGEYTKLMYDCLCDCHQVTSVEHHRLAKHEVRSCGCLKRELNSQAARERNTTHGLSKDARYIMWYNAKRRATENGREFSIEVEDIIIPSHCPVLGIELVSGSGAPTDTSPSLDRVDSSRGYTVDNIQVVSYRLNRLKNSFTIEEMEAVLKYMKDGKETYEKKE